MNNAAYTFIVKFKNEIKFSELPLFRGAVLNGVGRDGSILYHNHKDDNTLRYAYPFIQYKRIHKKAAVFCISEGVEVIGQILAAQKADVRLGDRVVSLEIETVTPQRSMVQTWDTDFTYHLRNWLPLSSKNYQEYRQIDEMSERQAFLENILIGNLLSFAKGVGIEVKKQITCHLISVSEPRRTLVKGVKVMSFDAEFKTNMSLPNYIGIGRHVSIGYGVVVKKYKDRNTNNEE